MTEQKSKIVEQIDRIIQAGKTSTSRHHHYVPRFYLRAFRLSDGHKNEVWVRRRDSKTWAKESTKSICVQDILYEIYIESGGTSMEVEGFFSMLESWMAPAIKKCGITPAALTEKERSTVSNFVGLQLVRSPVLLKEIMDRLRRELLDKMENVVSGKAENYAGIDTNVLADAIGYVENGSITIEPPKDHVIGMLLGIGSSLARSIYELSWRYQLAPEGTPFITCDHPVQLHGSPFGGRGGPRVDAVEIPISPGVAIQMARSTKDDYVVAKETMVSAVNRRTVERAQEVLISKHDWFPGDEALSSW